MASDDWSADHTSNLSDVAGAYVPALFGLIDNLTATIIVFSGKRAITSQDQETVNTVFENTFEMEQAGFVSFNDEIGARIAPNLREIQETADVDLLNNAFMNTTSFLYLVSEVYAEKYMKQENAKKFTSALSFFVAEFSLGRYGFSSDQVEVAEAINELVSSLRSLGLIDSFIMLLKQISLSQECTVQYGFVVGSKQQLFGCVAPMLKIATIINNSMRDCSRELHL